MKDGGKISVGVFSQWRGKRTSRKDFLAGISIDRLVIRCDLARFQAGFASTYRVWPFSFTIILFLVAVAAIVKRKGRGEFDCATD